MIFYSCVESRHWLSTNRLLLSMKLAVFLTLITVLQANAGGYAQTITLEVRNTPLPAVMERIQAQSGYLFFLKGEKLATLRVDANIKKAPLSDAMNMLAKDMGLEWVIKGKTIVIRAKEKRSMKADPAIDALQEKQQRVITGRVTDETGNPLEGVTVVVKGTTAAASTDPQGNYRITLPDKGNILSFSIVGFEPAERTIAKENFLNVTLNASVSNLDEVVVVGYGTQRRGDLTGAIVSISGDDFNRLPMTTLDQGIQGKVSGVQVVQTDAAPGGTVSVRIRGGNSINFSNEPLYVVDGFPTDDISSLNPKDIASMEILKDASATAIYGARGANGVVIITTLMAKENQSSLDIEAFTGLQKLSKKIPLLNATQYAELTNEAYIQDGREAPFPDPSALGEGTDWQDAIYRIAPMQNYQIAFLKGNDKTRYSLTGNYLDQDGIVINSNYKRLSLRFNLESDITDRLRIGNNLMVSHVNNNEVLVNAGGTGSAGVVHNSLTVTPDLPIYDENGDYFINWQQVGPGIRRDNSVSLAKEVTNQTLVGRAIGSFYIRYKLLEGLFAKLSVGADVDYLKHNLYVPRTTYRGYFANGEANINTGQRYNWLNENTLSYTKSFGDQHQLDMVLGYTLQREQQEELTAGGTGFVNDILSYNGLAGASVPDYGTSGASQWSLQSFLFRTNYSLADKYLFTIAARADGSSKFGNNNKFAWFPSAAFAWRVINEEFMKDAEWLSDLKLRVSYGLTGNQNIPLYRSQAALGTVNYIMGNSLAIGIVPTRVSNPDLKWEVNSQVDAGVDIGFLKNKLRMTIDAYYKRTNDLLMELSLPWTSGYSTSLQNVGSIENKGLELALEAQVLNNAFKWALSANYSMNKNKVLDLGGIPEFFGPTAGTGFYSPGPAIIVRTGAPVNSFYGYVADGLFRTQEDIDKGPKQRYMELGDPRFKDLNRDGVLDADDRTIIGNAQPDYIFGITNDFSYRNFSLNAAIVGVQGNEVLNAYRLYELESLRGTHNNHIRVLDRWSPDNPNASMPKADYRGHETFVSTRGIEDGSFIRLRNVVLSYTFPSPPVWLTKARIYISGQNLFTITRYTGYDPEVNTHGQNSINQGIDYGAYPRARTYSLGINLSF